MTESLAIEIARSKMQELKVQKYHLRYRHFVVQSTKVVSKHLSDWMILLTPDNQTFVSSRTGIFDLSDTNINELQYLHSGIINIENKNIKAILHVRFLQVIPMIEKT
jgi:hypothetical protein